MARYLRVGNHVFKLPTFRRVIKLIFLLAIIGFIGYIVVSCFLSNPTKPQGSTLPASANWVLTVQNTGGTLLCESYQVDKRGVYTIFNWWEFQKDRWVPHSKPFSLDPAKWGPIIVSHITKNM